MDYNAMKTNTYAEAKGATPFDWPRFLKQRTITPRKWTNATKRAAHWTTCACGNQCAIIPRHQGGCPTDDTLAELGARFYNAIAEHEKDRALSLLRAIEARSTTLIKRIIAI
jgi:hypothetical protein